MDNHVYIIIPFRATGVNLYRQQEYDFLIPYLNQYIKTVKFTIIVVEQNDNLKFNRGKLFNIGVIEAKKLFKENEYSFFCHQNIDIVPKSLDYNKYTNGINDIYGVPYGLGAMYFCDVNSYDTINGYPNNLFGWGGDDAALYERCKIENIYINRDDYISVFNINEKTDNFVYELNTDKKELVDQTNNSLNRNIVFNDDIINENYKNNGLNNCNYTIEKIKTDSALNLLHYYVNV